MNQHVEPAFTVATYNVLARVYLCKGDYSAVPAERLDPDWRRPALVRHVAGLDADLLCLQEVESEMFTSLAEGLGPRGYAGRMEFKGCNKPDGCATFYRTGVFTLRNAQRLEYSDDERGPGAPSGHIALLMALEHGGRLLGIANTHLRWDRPGTPCPEQIGYRQARELLAAVGSFEPVCGGWIVCGDFNRMPESELVATFHQAGFKFAHADRPQVRSAVVNRRALLIDYLFHDGKLRATPIDPPPVSNDTVLPSAEQPSDHLPLMARFAW